MRVLDASAVVEWFLGGERGEKVATALLEPGAEPLVAPDLLDVEVAQAFRRLVRRGDVDEVRGAAAIDLLGRIPVERHPVRVLLPRVWALRANLTTYDAAYVSLAEALACPLITCDARLGSAPGHGAKVVVI